MTTCVRLKFLSLSSHDLFRMWGSFDCKFYLTTLDELLSSTLYELSVKMWGLGAFT